jgi:hypothetical protein
VVGVTGSDASFGADGSCRLTNDVLGTEAAWTSVEEWAAAWFAEWRGNEHGAACDFIDAAGDDAVPGVVEALVVLAESAGGDEQVLSWIGAGPLENLVSHSGNGLLVLADVDRAARQNIAFRAALRTVWLGSDVPEPVRVRLTELGATDLSQ